MRQFFTWQFWAALVGLAAALGVAFLISERASSDLDLERAIEPIEHRIDLIVPIVEARPESGFAVVDGQARGRLTLALDGGRRATILDGTPGESTCTLVSADAPVPCVLAADLLGEAVVWFSLVPAPTRSTIDLPPVVELRDDRWTLLSNGWEVQRAPVVERSCEADTTSLTEFVRRFGPTSVTSFSLVRQEIVEVSCAAAPGTATGSG